MKKIFFASGYFMVVAGVTSIFIAIFADAIGIGDSGFGLNQLSGVILGLFALSAGLVELYAANKTKIARVLAGSYISGVLFMGLIPKHFDDSQVQLFWDANTIFSRDFFTNTIGFILIGYLFMLSIEDEKTPRGIQHLFKKALMVVLAGCALSSFLEVAQYFLIPGRVASSADVVANTFGTIVGIFLYTFRLPLRQTPTRFDISSHSDSGNTSY
jgi:RsiW-degrading membrane proteinase PrsW (M82 family)